MQEIVFVLFIEFGVMSAVSKSLFAVSSVSESDETTLRLNTTHAQNEQDGSDFLGNGTSCVNSVECRAKDANNFTDNISSSGQENIAFIRRNETLNEHLQQKDHVFQFSNESDSFAETTLYVTEIQLDDLEEEEEEITFETNVSSSHLNFRPNNTSTMFDDVSSSTLDNSNTEFNNSVNNKSFISTTVYTENVRSPSLTTVEALVNTTITQNEGLAKTKISETGVTSAPTIFYEHGTFRNEKQKIWSISDITSHILTAPSVESSTKPGTTLSENVPTYNMNAKQDSRIPTANVFETFPTSLPTSDTKTSKATSVELEGLINTSGEFISTDSSNLLTTSEKLETMQIRNDTNIKISSFLNANNQEELSTNSLLTTHPTNVDIAEYSQLEAKSTSKLALQTFDSNVLSATGRTDLLSDMSRQGSTSKVLRSTESAVYNSSLSSTSTMSAVDVMTTFAEGENLDVSNYITSQQPLTMAATVEQPIKTTPSVPFSEKDSETSIVKSFSTLGILSDFRTTVDTKFSQDNTAANIYAPNGDPYSDVESIQRTTVINYLLYKSTVEHSSRDTNFLNNTLSASVTVTHPSTAVPTIWSAIKRQKTTAAPIMEIVTDPIVASNTPHALGEFDYTSSLSSFVAATTKPNYIQLQDSTVPRPTARRIPKIMSETQAATTFHEQDHASRFQTTSPSEVVTFIQDTVSPDEDDTAANYVTTGTTIVSYHNADSKFLLSSATSQIFPAADETTLGVSSEDNSVRDHTAAQASSPITLNEDNTIIDVLKGETSTISSHDRDSNFPFVSPSETISFSHGTTPTAEEITTAASTITTSSFFDNDTKIWRSSSSRITPTERGTTVDVASTTSHGILDGDSELWPSPPSKIITTSQGNVLPNEKETTIKVASETVTAINFHDSNSQFQSVSPSTTISIISSRLPVSEETATDMPPTSVGEEKDFIEFPKHFHTTMQPEEITSEDASGIITATFIKPHMRCEKDWVENQTLLFRMWLVQTVVEGIGNMTTNWSLLARVGMDQDIQPDMFLPEVIFVFPTPFQTDEELIFTFFVRRAKRNGTISADTLLPILVSNADKILNILNLNESHFARGTYNFSDNSKDSFRTADILDDYGTLIIIITSVALLTVCTLLFFAIYTRRRSRISIHCITDRDRFQQDMHIAVEVGDINPAVVILQDEIRETGEIKNGKLLAVGDDEGWVVPINQVPVEDKDSPEVQDTKL